MTEVTPTMVWRVTIKPFSDLDEENSTWGEYDTFDGAARAAIDCLTEWCTANVEAALDIGEQPEDDEGELRDWDENMNLAREHAIANFDLYLGRIAELSTAKEPEDGHFEEWSHLDGISIDRVLV